MTNAELQATGSLSAKRLNVEVDEDDYRVLTTYLPKGVKSRVFRKILRQLVVYIEADPEMAVASIMAGAIDGSDITQRCNKAEWGAKFTDLMKEFQEGTGQKLNLPNFLNWITNKKGYYNVQVIRPQGGQNVSSE